MKIGNREFSGGQTYVMGILNVTPDSFSDGGKYVKMDRALYKAQQMAAEGAAIIDLGGESTRPGYERISVQQELDRVLPVIEAIKARVDIPVSLDTYKSEVARGGLLAGADMVNDIWGLKYDEQMGRVIAQSNKPCCLMHNRENAEYNDLITDVIGDLGESIKLADMAGIPRDHIILDPGVGFGKTYEQNLEIIHSILEFSRLNLPVLLGASRKSVVGLTLNLPADQRLEGTLVTTVFAVLGGCTFVRVHDVKENVRTVRMAEAIKNGRGI